MSTYCKKALTRTTYRRIYRACTLLAHGLLEDRCAQMRAESMGRPRQPTRLSALTALRMAPRLPSLAADYENYDVVSTSTVAKNLSLGSRGAEEPAKNLRLSSRALSS